MNYNYGTVHKIRDYMKMIGYTDFEIEEGELILAGFPVDIGTDLSWNEGLNVLMYKEPGKSWEVA